jgi:hypothetical protein
MVPALCRGPSVFTRAAMDAHNGIFLMVLKHRRPGMNFIEHLIFEPRGGKVREFEGLTTHFEPKDFTLYRKLLPAAFSMPDQPIVTIFIADYVRLVP